MPVASGNNSEIKLFAGTSNPDLARKVALNVGELERFAAGTEVTEAVLREARLVQGAGVVIKVLGEGKLTKKLTVSAHSFSKSAVEKIEKAGGKAVTISLPEPKPVTRKSK